MKHILELDRKKLPKVVFPFFMHVIKTANKYGVQVNLIDKKLIKICDGGDVVHGYFTEIPTPSLNVAIKNPFESWFPVLVHEFSHMEQCHEDTKVWRDGYVMDTDVSTILDLWLFKHIELSPKQVKNVVKRTRDVEVDAERRAVKTIEKFGLPIDTAEYIQKANAYAFFYTAVGETRNWPSNKKEAYEIPEIWSQMPNHLDCNYNVLTPKIRKAFRQVMPGL